MSIGLNCLSDKGVLNSITVSYRKSKYSDIVLDLYWEYTVSGLLSAVSADVLCEGFPWLFTILQANFGIVCRSGQPLPFVSF